MKPRAIAAACALAAGLCGLSALAATAEATATSRETEMRKFIWEQSLAFLHARGDKVVPRSPYEPMALVKLPDARAAFERAGGKLVVQPTLSTSDLMLQQAIVKTFQKMLSGPGGCCPCSAAATCSDSLFCNGVEICAAGACAPGPAPCNDGNPCTNDSCTENTDACTFTPVPPPAEVAQLDVKRFAPLSTVASLSWSGVGGATSYNIYRGASRTLGDLACFQSGVTGTSLDDDGVRPTVAFYYLVSSQACGVSSIGTGNPNPRPPAPSCP